MRKEKNRTGVKAVNGIRRNRYKMDGKREHEEIGDLF